MKTCKKCKKSNQNQAKLCKYCGADISVVKPNINKNKNNNVKVKKEQVKKVEEKALTDTKTEVLFTQVYKADLSKKIKNNEETKTEILFTSDLKPVVEKKKKIIRVAKIKLKKNKKKEINEQLNKFFTSDYQNAADNYYPLNEKTHLKKEKIKSDKKEKVSFKEKLNDIKNKSKESKTKKQKEKDKSTFVKNKIEIQDDLTRAQQLYLVKKKLQKRKLLKIAMLFLVFCFIGYLGYKVYANYSSLGYIIEEKHCNKTFNMGDVITYKDISYTITKVETSKGTLYKKPKEGNQYLIVSIKMENHSNSKYHYSGEYFTMINSNEEETSKIISPVNAGRALYSGNLVVGGTKEGSLVFEEPIDDKDLKLLFYNSDELDKYEEEVKKQEELLLEETEEENKDEEQVKVPAIKRPKPVFKVKIVAK